jgi:hypothetical protein
VIVTVVEEGVPTKASPVMLPRATLKVSSPSKAVSSSTGTVMVLTVSPAAKLSTPAGAA